MTERNEFQARSNAPSQLAGAQATPFILGMPLLLAWIVLWILLTSAIMGLIYALDPANRGEDDR